MKLLIGTDEDAYKVVLGIVEASTIRSVSQERLGAFKTLQSYHEEIVNQEKTLAALLEQAEEKIVRAIQNGNQPEPGFFQAQVEKVVGRVSRSWQKAALHFAAKLQVTFDEATKLAERYGNGRKTKYKLTIR